MRKSRGKFDFNSNFWPDTVLGASSVRERYSFFVLPKTFMKYLEGNLRPWIVIALVYKRGYCQGEVFDKLIYNNMNIL